MSPHRIVVKSLAILAAALALAVGLVLGGAGCGMDTSRLGPAQEQALEGEGILQRAPNLVFRHTENSRLEGSRWRDVVASIVVTKETVLIHRNQRELLRITPRSRRVFRVVRRGPRIRIQVVGSRSSETWSFVPPGAPDRWAEDVRAVTRPAGARAGPAPSAARRGSIPAASSSCTGSS